MHIVFLHNLQTSLTPEQAEFDTPETVEAIRAALERAGHRVTLVEASVSASHLVTRLESLAPDLVLNTAEGTRGRFREGFYPGLLEQLGIPYTGSDAYTCTLTLDKHLTKLAVAEHGIRVPAWCFVTDAAQIEGLKLNYPLMVKPNFEGSSKGITQDSVVRNADQLKAQVEHQLALYPSGLLVEEFIEGRDVTVPFLEIKGVLEPAHYVFGGPERKHAIYDYELKQHRSDDVQVVCPADVDKKTRTELKRITAEALKILNVRDLGRVDYRVNDRGEAYLIEVNALPSLEPGAAIYLCAGQVGLKTEEAVLQAVIKSAVKRQAGPAKVTKSRKPRVALTYNLKRSTDAQEAEFDSPKTVAALVEAIQANGCDAVAIEATPDITGRLEEIDLVFNIAEGFRGRNRESQVPALLELLDIDFTGSDACCLALTLDKALAKAVVREKGIPTPDFLLMQTGKERLPKDLNYPLFLKPVAEGSSKGIATKCVAHSAEEVVKAARELITQYRQPTLVEEFLPGREFTVGILGNKRLRMLPVMEVLFGPQNRDRVYSFEHKLDMNEHVTFKVPADITPALHRQIEKVAKGAFRALGCRDVARIDLRMDEQGVVNFIECNPLPGLSPGFSDLCVIAEAGGLNYQELVGEILAPALKRWKTKRRTLVKPT